MLPVVEAEPVSVVLLVGRVIVTLLPALTVGGAWVVVLPLSMTTLSPLRLYCNNHW